MNKVGRCLECWVRKDMEAGGRGLFQSILQPIAWINLGKPRRSSVSIAVNSSKIQTGHLPNSSLLGYPYTYLLEVQHRWYQSPQLGMVLNQFNPAHILPTYFAAIQFNITLPSLSWSSERLPNKILYPGSQKEISHQSGWMDDSLKPMYGGNLNRGQLCVPTGLSGTKGPQPSY
jgi:hypothetical protein